MLVEAIKRGFYGNILREPGSRFAVFRLTDAKHFSEKWMRKVEDPRVVETQIPVVKRDTPKTFVELMQQPDMQTSAVPRETAQQQVQSTKLKKDGAAKSTGDQQVI